MYKNISSLYSLFIVLGIASLMLCKKKCAELNESDERADISAETQIIDIINVEKAIYRQDI